VPQIIASNRLPSWMRASQMVMLVAVLMASSACASRTVRVTLEGLVEEAGALGAEVPSTRSFQTQFDLQVGKTLTIPGRAGDPTVVRIRTDDVSAGVATFTLEVSRRESGREVVLASPRLKAHLGEEVVAESRDNDSVSGLRYFKFALLPRLLGATD
jgi:hypothetical protein